VSIRHFLWHLLRFRPRLYIFSLLLSWGYYTLPLLLGLVLRAFFNALSGEAELPFEVWALAVLFLSVQVAVQVFEQGYAALYLYFEGSLKALIRQNLFRSLLKDGDARAGPHAGEVLNRFEEDADGVVAPIATSMSLSGQALSALTALLVMLSINPYITSLAVLPMVGVVGITRWMGVRIQHYRRASREGTGRVAGFLGEVLGAVQAIKVAGTEGAAVQRFQALSEVRRQAVVQDALFGQVLNSMNAAAITLAIGAVLALAGLLMKAESFTLGDLALFVSYIASGGVSISVFAMGAGQLLASFKQAEVYLERLLTLLPNGAPEKLVASGPVYLRGAFPKVPHIAKTAAHRLKSLRVERLTYGYPETGRGIEDISFELERGSFAVITGRMGSGKTTLLETLLGLLPKERGAIYWNGHPVADPAAFLVPPRCAYVPQVPYLFSDTLKENILMGIPEEAVDLRQAIHRAVMEKDVETLEREIDTLVGPRGVRLSGGQVQRTAAARMFAREAELMVLDDLSSALDVDTEQLLWERLLAQQEATCVVVSHRRTVLRLARHILVLKDGHLEAEGGLEELLEQCAEMREIWRGVLRTGPAKV
jgi:ATP-binding cassette subfamily B protein